MTDNPDIARQFRTCFYCKVVHPTVKGADDCEARHLTERAEKRDGAKPSGDAK